MGWAAMHGGITLRHLLNVIIGKAQPAWDVEACMRPAPLTYTLIAQHF